MASTRSAGFAAWLTESGYLFHDDVVADFGGNDGTAARAFFAVSCVKPVVVDCEPARLDFAAQSGLQVRRAFLEDLSSFPDKSVRHAFCSHTMEHCRDAAKALREIARVVSGYCYFVFPIEKHEHGEANHAHAIVCESAALWKSLLIANGWRIVKGKTMLSRSAIMEKTPSEYECIAEPA